MIPQYIKEMARRLWRAICVKEIATKLPSAGGPGGLAHMAFKRIERQRK